MDDVYRRLAKRLDELPNGFPETESGVELRILKKIFSPEEAETALLLSPLPETAEAIAGRLDKPASKMRDILDDMAKRGQIGSFTLFGQQMYMLIAFVPGIYDFQVYRMDREFVDLYDEYESAFLKGTGSHRPAVARVVPINDNIEVESRVQLYEDVRKIVEKSSSFLLVDCICRKERAMLGLGCDHTIRVCLYVSIEKNAYDYFSIGGEVISKEEALDILKDAEEEGLVHMTYYNVQKGHSVICNCCTCCCHSFRGAINYGAPHMFMKSNFIAAIDKESCTACGTCAEERCPVVAIVKDGDSYRVMEDKCIGCGLCAVTCPADSISLVEREEAERDEPPKNFIEWNISRAKSRGIELKLK
ncbi:MAG: 4Fe-4S binding protein [Deltaproteobacteria bacterium]|uniref:4Fe-4S binding protein n=1 Tax=Candidatus Zymogenus saltonus TaxID=2844893 RepID=A0A9D8PRB2_9DELT|nr:4Fe-4S binding protein [Candidatus Zymogenus saltonus]